MPKRGTEHYQNKDGIDVYEFKVKYEYLPNRRRIDQLKKELS
jgi:hypothetical protein